MMAVAKNDLENSWNENKSHKKDTNKNRITTKDLLTKEILEHTVHTH